MVRRGGVVGLLCLALMSCSGTADEAMPKSAYIAEADEICTGFMDAGVALGAGATPDDPKAVDEVLPFLSHEELAYLDETAAASQTGTLTDGIVGDVLGYAAWHCDTN